MDIISQGAEAILVREESFVLKRRTPKTYRHSRIDARLRKSRTNRELKVLKKAANLGVRVPKIYESDEPFTIKMDYIGGRRLRDHLLDHPEANHLLEQVGKWLATLHENNIMHGDLTTSNVLIVGVDELYLIDFGLSLFSTKIEDRAVEVHLFEQAVESTHYLNKKKFFASFLKGYAASSRAKEVLERLEVVRGRGRNKQS